LEESNGRICILDSESFPEVVEQLAKDLSLPVLSQNDLRSPEASMLSQAVSVQPYESGNIHDYTVGICQFVDDLGSKRRRKGSPKRKLSMNPFSVDLCPPSMSSLGKRSYGQAGPDLLTKAVSPRKGFEVDCGAVVYDLTAGFGQDSLLIARAGAKRVCMVERNPIVAALLADALRRLIVLSEKSCDESTRILALSLSECLSLKCQDGKQVIETLLDQTELLDTPDIVYLDPMFPARKKSASVKKNMQILHSLLGSEEIDVASRQNEEELLLQEAYKAAKVRVVVKRPINAPPIGNGIRPSYELLGSINRWDIYLKGSS
jgi:16S rRNA (guanine1516-N2)-methyltransferase